MIQSCWAPPGHSLAALNPPLANTARIGDCFIANNQLILMMHHPALSLGQGGIPNLQGVAGAEGLIWAVPVMP